MQSKGQMIMLWSTPVAGVLFLICYLMFPAFSPPLSPQMTPEQVAAFFQENLATMRGVVVFGNLIGCLLVPLFAVIVVQMLRVINSSQVFAYSYLICVGIGITAFILADFAWGIALYRPDRDPQLISLLNDMAWFFFITPAGVLVVQNLCLAGAIYLDERPQPVFPRWVAHFNVLTALLFVPAAFSIMHKTGPLAWDGFLSNSLRLAAFTVYVAVMFWVMLGVVRQQVADEGVTL
ncbi:hypothetical protein E4634_00145 [Mangrovimicrobium sediminis]|uniref:DUF998 domain-containing protein n=1 Tax=Mangrovimicrobium sediminis TaxID=2562682 RepID=A0A4Z0M8Z5_9GAMM|nr:hypothetical protein [Haliea sp. SAOS-164]TGD76001.1 hypothetical protein E4634_00145 [Haliea sp. SAOS-164]